LAAAVGPSRPVHPVRRLAARRHGLSRSQAATPDRPAPGVGRLLAANRNDPRHGPAVNLFCEALLVLSYLLPLAAVVRTRRYWKEENSTLTRLLVTFGYIVVLLGPIYLLSMIFRIGDDPAENPLFSGLTLYLCGIATALAIRVGIWLALPTSEEAQELSPSEDRVLSAAVRCGSSSH
jgi:hypothetical protein